jgi:hypothetical protein
MHTTNGQLTTAANTGNASLALMRIGSLVGRQSRHGRGGGGGGCRVGITNTTISLLLNPIVRLSTRGGTSRPILKASPIQWGVRRILLLLLADGLAWLTSCTMSSRGSCPSTGNTPALAGLVCLDTEWFDVQSRISSQEAYGALLTNVANGAAGSPCALAPSASKVTYSIYEEERVVRMYKRWKAHETKITEKMNKANTRSHTHITDIINNLLDAYLPYPFSSPFGMGYNRSH